MRSSALWVVLLGAGLAGAGGFGAACAASGHTSIGLADDDAGASGGEGGGTGGGDSGGGCSPVALNVPIFASSCKSGPPTVDWSPMRRISRVEYDNMVRDLLGDTTQPAVLLSFSPESPMAVGVNFLTNTPNSKPTVGVSLLAGYQSAAEALAKTAVSSSATLSSILPCTTQDEACAQQFISTFANRAFRGQLDAPESISLLGVYQDVVAAGFGFTEGIQGVITAILESPRFLYVLEFGSGTAATNGVIPLSSYEVAGRLALLLWRSVPDAALMSAAASGALATGAPGQAQAVQMQAKRMLADPKAVGAINDFTTQWVELEGTASQAKDTQFANWKTYTGEEMLDETLTNVSQIVLVKNGGLNDLLTSPTSYVNQDLASFYGVTMGSGTSVNANDPVLVAAAMTTPSVTSQFVSTALPNRAGVLTNGSVMATQAHSTLPSSVLRGKLVREDLLCDPIQGPPPNVPPAPTAPAVDGGTTRSLFEAHLNKASSCYPTCHKFMDPIGFGFGFFDASGAWQATDANGFTGTFPAIDASGQVFPMATADLSVTFNGATDLTTKLAGSTQVKECFALQEMRYALTRLETADDVCSLHQMYSAFTGSNFNIQALLLAVVGTDAFLYRSAEVPGSECLAAGSSCL
jgi:hypothetical protein